MIGLAVTASLSIPFILGDKWLPTVPLLICLVPLGLTQAMWAPVSGVLIGLGRSDLIFKLGLVGSIMTIAAIVFGVFFGSTAVALGVSFASIFSLSRAFRAALDNATEARKARLGQCALPLSLPC
jgi:O-antigen/teichoic acid export membrane protein